MSREMKFRAWDNAKKEWTLNIMECVSSRTGDIWMEPALKSHKVLIEQYTGLKDKNGKEIYEGDIVRWADCFNEEHIFKVEWQENRARFCLRNEEDHYDYEDLNDRKKPYIEVIGTIHENPELLEGK